MFHFLLLCCGLMIISIYGNDNDNLNSIWICESGDSKVLGEYMSDPDAIRDSCPVYTNQNEISIFRNSGLWYIGNLNEWPPETHYRCDNLNECGYEENIPPISKGKWTIVKRFGKSPAPILSSAPCVAIHAEL